MRTISMVTMQEIRHHDDKTNTVRVRNVPLMNSTNITFLLIIQKPLLLSTIGYIQLATYNLHVSLPV